MKYSDLRDFISQLQQIGELKRIATPVSPHLEITEICDRTLRAAGPALLFENAGHQNIPVLANLFGTPRRVALGDARLAGGDADVAAGLGRVLLLRRQLGQLRRDLRPAGRGRRRDDVVLGHSLCCAARCGAELRT